MLSNVFIDTIQFLIFEVCHKLPKMTCEEATKELVYSLMRNRNKESNMSWHGKICGDICKWKTETLFFQSNIGFHIYHNFGTSYLC